MLHITSPYDLRVIASIHLQDESFAELFFQQASKLNPLPIHQRIEILERTIILLTEQQEAIAELATFEGGKPIIDSRIEVQRAIQGIKVAIAELYHLKGEQIPMGVTTSSMHRIAYTMREPVGLVFAISAFNHPVNLIVHQIIPAIATGCPVVIKPDLRTPLSAIHLVQLLYEAGLPEPYCRVLCCENSVAERYVTDERIKFFSFIGSYQIGLRLKKILPSFIPATFEHGGAAPVIIEPDADIHDLIPLLIKGGFYHAGQVCVSVQRIFIHESIFTEVSEQLIAATEKLVVGNPLDDQTEVGPMILPRELHRIQEWINQSNAKQIACGGKALSRTCYAPTILIEPEENSLVSNKEIFGPVICLYSYQNLSEAIAKANALHFCFQASIFTQQLNKAIASTQQLKARTVLINDHTAFRVDWMPFAASEQSGFGTGGIPYTMRDMTQEKLWIIRSGDSA